MPDPSIGQGFNQDIAYRYKPGQTAAEFYSQKTGEVFGDPNKLASYVNTNFQGANADPSNVFGVLAGGYTPRSQQLQQITNQLNQTQNQTFQQQEQPAKRQSSVIAENIATENQNLADALAEFNTLKEKLGSLPAPNYEQTYLDLRTKAGIPGIENDFAGNQKTIRELPYVNRQNFGNAGVATEGQLAADTQQKGIPLEIQQANLLDRLKLAGDFVANSLKFKEMDATSAREAIGTAIALAGQSIGFTRDSLNDLFQRQQYETQLEQEAQKFAIENAINAPYYQVGNTIYDTATRTPKYVNNGGTISTVDGSKAYSTPQEFFKDSGINSFEQIYTINSTTVADKNAVLDLRQKYPDAGILPTDSFSVASSKLGNSRIYQEQVRPPQSAGGGADAGVLGLSNQQIDNISPLVTQFQNSPIVQNYNTIGETLNAVRSAGNTPTDDIQRIYAFAKIMDPASAVREGEYDTIQAYSTALLERYGLQTRRVFDNAGFLTNEARGFLINTLENRFKASENSYKNLYTETYRRINLIGSTDKGEQLLNNYGGAFQPTGSGSFVGPVNPNTQPASQPAKESEGWWKKTTNWLFGD